MHKYLVEMLECPICHHQLNWQIEREIEDRIEQAGAHCTGRKAVYPVMDGIGIFLTPDLPRNDLWNQVDSQLALYLKSHPEHETKLMGTLVEDLSPTDQQLRALVLDERGDFKAGKKVEEIAYENLYTTGFKVCWENQIDYSLDSLKAFEGPVVDFASGRCYLVEKIAGQLRRPVVATDFSPAVLRRDRNYFQYLKLDHLVSLLAFDARMTPFKDESINIMTTNLGLSNIEEPGELVNELNRILGGIFLAVSHFYPMEDSENGAVIKEAGIEAFMYRESALKHFSDAGMETMVENTCFANALPTPLSEIFEGTRADGLPVVPTELEWCTIRAGINVIG